MKRPSALLQSKAAEIDALYRTAPIGLCLIDRSLRYVRINERLAEMNGIPAADHIGRTVREVIPAVADVEPLLRRVLHTGRPVLNREIAGQTAAHPGVTRIWTVNYVPLRGASGETLGVNIAVEEITEARRVQEERARQVQLRALASRLQSVREEERTRLARELHDELGQALTAIKLGLKWVAGQTAASAPGVRERLGSLDELLDCTTRALRRISEGLRPPLLDLIGLAATIRENVKEFQAKTGIRCVVDVPRLEPRLPPETATALFRIFQEALTNVSRHARATRLEVSLRSKGRAYVLRIGDNGRGIPRVALADVRALGLLGMRERALAVDGTAEILGSRGRGSTITITVPAGEPRAPKAHRDLTGRIAPQTLW